MNDNTDADCGDDYEITVERDVEPPENAIDLEALVESEGLDGAAEEVLRQFGATDEEIERLVHGDED